MKKVFKLRDLDCANCARKMEDAIRKIDGVEDVQVSFMTQKLTLVADEVRFDEIVEKAVNMAKMMNIPVLGIVENMSWIACPDCGKKIYPFGEGKTLQVAQAHSLPLLAQLPIQPELASACDKGLVELFNENWLDGAADVVEHTPARKL